MTVTQIKKIRVLIDEKIAECRQQVEEWEKLRNSTLFEIGNILHDDVPVSNDEVNFIITHPRFYPGFRQNTMNN